MKRSRAALVAIANVPYWAQSIATGAALVIVTGLDELSQKRDTVRRLVRTRG